MSRFMTDWERRGYLSYPRTNTKPKPGTREEHNWSKGWTRAQRDEQLTKQDYLSAEIDFESELGRNTYAVEYVPKEDENKLEF